jgi:hypothetical protein
MEETGLTSEYIHKGIYHELVFQAENGEQLEDKIFHVVLCTNISGHLIEKFEGGRNVWKNLEQVEAEPNKFESYKFEADITLGKLEFIERKVEYSKNQF